MKQKGYRITLLFFWLNSVELAFNRVEERAKKGGHNIPKDIIERRYLAGLKNLNILYFNEFDYWKIYDNSFYNLEMIAQKNN